MKSTSGKFVGAHLLRGTSDESANTKALLSRLGARPMGLHAPGGGALTGKAAAPSLARLPEAIAPCGQLVILGPKLQERQRGKNARGCNEMHEAPSRNPAVRRQAQRHSGGPVSKTSLLSIKLISSNIRPAGQRIQYVFDQEMLRNGFL